MPSTMEKIYQKVTETVVSICNSNWFLFLLIPFYRLYELLDCSLLVQSTNVPYCVSPGSEINHVTVCDCLIRPMSNFHQ